MSQTLNTVMKPKTMRFMTLKVICPVDIIQIRLLSKTMIHQKTLAVTVM